jgi:hypothetical protein
MAITRSRHVQTNEVVLDQADFFQGNGFDRVPGLTISSVAVQVFWNNQLQPWPLTDGTPVTNALAAAGYVYWNEIPGAAGFYSVRWRPTGTGYWRVVLTYATGTQTVCLDYDVIPESATVSETGLKAVFVKP